MYCIVGSLRPKHPTLESLDLLTRLIDNTNSRVIISLDRYVQTFTETAIDSDIRLIDVKVSGLVVEGRPTDYPTSACVHQICILRLQI